MKTEYEKYIDYARYLTELYNDNAFMMNNGKLSELEITLSQSEALSFIEWKRKINNGK